MRNVALVVLAVLPGFIAAQTPLPGAPEPPPTVQKATPGTVVVEVRHDGKPVAAANVTLDDGKKKQDVLIDPSSQGDAEFNGVKPGSVKVTVKYRAKGADASPVTQIFDIKGAGDATPHVTVALPGDAETIASTGPAGPPAGAEGQPAASATKAPESSGGFNFVGTLFALLVGGAAAAGIWYFIKQNPDTVGGTLEKLGAQIPKPGDAPLADPPVASAPAPVAPEPPQKIVLDPSPDPIQMSPYTPSAPIAVSVSEPSLISDSGVPLPLGEGETVVGREIGLGLSLAGETTVSRRHARIVRTGGSATLFDEGSTNGTFVNGQRIAGSMTLQPGDAVQFGSVRFRYES